MNDEARMLSRLESNMPAWKDEISKHLASLQLEPAREAEIVEELAQHLDDRYQEMLAGGASEEEARRATLAELSQSDMLAKELRRVERPALAEPVVLGAGKGNMTVGLWQDLRYAVRMLRRRPSFTLVAVLSLSLGIGANTAIFQLLNAVRLRPLPVKDPHELVEVRIADASTARGSWTSWHAMATNPIWEQVRDQQQAFSGISAWGIEPYLNLASGGEPRFARGLWVSGDFFNVLGVQPVLGRVFSPADDQRGCPSPGVVISHSFWQTEFGGDASVIGKTLKLDGRPFEIIGVTPASFFGLEIGRSYDVAVPICSEAILNGENSQLDAGTSWWLAIIGRLKPGWSLDRATAHLNSISPGVFEASLPRNYPSENVKDYLAFKLAAYPGSTGVSQLREPYETPLWLLLAITGLVLLIACANLANLLLARASAREREIAVRLALGASRGRLVRQLLTESLLLAIAGACFGALLAHSLSRFLVSFISTEGDPVFVALDTDWRVLAFTAGLAILTCALFGLMPAVRGTRVSPGEVMKASSRGLTARGERFGLRRALIVSQVAISLVLLVGAFLFTRSLNNLLALDAGFQPNGLMALYVNPADMEVPLDRRLAFKQELLNRLNAVPGVESAAHTNVVPLSGTTMGNRVWMDGSDSRQARSSYRSKISSDYFKTAGTPLLAGRGFDDRDRLSSPNVAIVSETFARELAGGANPVGKRFWVEATPQDPATLYEIVGLVRDAKYRDIREEIAPVFFEPASQDPRPGLFTQVLLRFNADPASVLTAVKQAIAEINPAIVTTSGLLRTQIENSLLRERLMAMLSGLFGALALALACVGLYAIMSYSVTSRTNEIGIRIALGAQPRAVLWLVMRESILLVLIGAAVGLSTALVATRFVSSLLFGLRPADPVSICLAVGLLFAVALSACLIPARRASRVDPVEALRYE
jgi:predicted permease